MLLYFRRCMLLWKTVLPIKIPAHKLKARLSLLYEDRFQYLQAKNGAIIHVVNWKSWKNVTSHKRLSGYLPKENRKYADLPSCSVLYFGYWLLSPIKYLSLMPYENHFIKTNFMNLKINVSGEIMFLLKEKHLRMLCVRSPLKHLANTDQQQGRTA